MDRHEGPHQPASPAPRDENAYPAISLPHPPSFDEKDVSDKPDWVSDNPPLSLEQKRYMEELYRKRLQSMLAVDDMIGDLMGALHDSGELDNTYIVFTSDNGFHLGQHRLGAGKWTPYEEDIRVPLIVRGPGVPEGETLHHMVLNNDLAPTFADLAGAEPPSFVDGRSLPLLTDDPNAPARLAPALRYRIRRGAQRGATPALYHREHGGSAAYGRPAAWQLAADVGRERPIEREWGRPWLKALRTKNYLYVDYKTGEHELYDLRKDPHELHNMYATAPPEITQRLEAQLDALRQCSAEECRAARASRAANRKATRE